MNLLVITHKLKRRDQALKEWLGVKYKHEYNRSSVTEESGRIHFHLSWVHQYLSSWDKLFVLLDITLVNSEIRGAGSKYCLHCLLRPFWIFQFFITSALLLTLLMFSPNKHVTFLLKPTEKSTYFWITFPCEYSLNQNL